MFTKTRTRPTKSSSLPVKSGRLSAKFYAEMGCDIIAIVDPVASQIKPETFREFVTPNCQPAIKAIHDAGKTSSFFICGDCTRVMEEVCKIGTHGFAIDEQLNLLWVRDMALKYGVGFGGNLETDPGLESGIVVSARRCDRQSGLRRGHRIYLRPWLRHAL